MCEDTKSFQQIQNRDPLSKKTLPHRTKQRSRTLKTIAPGGRARADEQCDKKERPAVPTAPPEHEYGPPHATLLGHKLRLLHLLCIFAVGL